MNEKDMPINNIISVGSLKLGNIVATNDNVYLVICYMARRALVSLYDYAEYNITILGIENTTSDVFNDTVKVVYDKCEDFNYINNTILYKRPISEIDSLKAKVIELENIISKLKSSTSKSATDNHSVKEMIDGDEIEVGNLKVGDRFKLEQDSNCIYSLHENLETKNNVRYIVAGNSLSIYTISRNTKAWYVKPMLLSAELPKANDNIKDVVLNSLKIGDSFILNNDTYKILGIKDGLSASIFAKKALPCVNSLGTESIINVNTLVKPALSTELSKSNTNVENYSGYVLLGTLKIGDRFILEDNSFIVDNDNDTYKILDIKYISSKLNHIICSNSSGIRCSLYSNQMVKHIKNEY